MKLAGQVRSGWSSTKTLNKADKRTAQDKRWIAIEPPNKWQAIHACAQPLIWTDRMLSALQFGVKGGKWYSLMDKVRSRHNLSEAFTHVHANKGAAGVDNQSVAHFEKGREKYLSRLEQELMSGRYRPQPVKRVYIPKPGSSEMRPLGIPTVRDRTVQQALRNLLEPIFEHDFSEHSYGFRPKRGCHHSLVQVQMLLNEGYEWIVDADIRGYFDTIPREPLMRLIEEKIADGEILKLIRLFLEQGIMEQLKYWIPEEGTPQGAVISPLLSNIYLDPLDKLMESQGYNMVRYADDFIVLCQTKEQAEAALRQIQQWMQQAGLTLHPTKTRLVDHSIDGFDFLGYHFERGHKWPRQKSEKKIKDAIRGKTKRNNGKSMEEITGNLNSTLRGWGRYFIGCGRNTFVKLDQMTRRRLRRILRKRNKRPRGTGRNYTDHQRWPNAYFKQLGLFSLTEFWDCTDSPLRG